jgi:hypothetical protein
MLKKADLVIYQPLSDVYNCYSTNKNNPESFMKELSDSCITISFPRLHNDALFPIFHKRYNKLTNEIYGLNETIASLRIEDRMRLYDCNLLDFKFNERFNKNLG